MNLAEQKKFGEMEKNVGTLLKIQAENSDKLDQVLEALKGNDLGDPGLVKRLESVERDLRDLRTERTRNGVYITIIKWLAGIIVVLVIGYMFNAAFNKQPAQINNNAAPQKPI